jgi:predicted HNH restriction endonuclease
MQIIQRDFNQWGVIHYLGLYSPHKAFFQNWDPEDAISFLFSKKEIDSLYALIASYLQNYLVAIKKKNINEDNENINYNINNEEGAYWIERYLLSSTQLDCSDLIDKKLLLMEKVDSSDKSVRIGTKKYYYSSNALKTTVKSLYDYHCQVCQVRIYRPGWSKTMGRISQWKYLVADAHHIIPLSEGGYDALNNLLCLCPNCHRRFHSKEFELIRHDGQLFCDNLVLGKRLKVKEKHKIDIRDEHL